ncbi:MAG: 4-demethylwyosine synthase TYW1 [Methanosphaera sp.]|jgi:tRNA wybutosine-synthesizing protein 1|uniref:4-demethylwyosine synthase TYW1 n=1 Tax=Methanosphaera TaxID=2316 RepID=UPI0023800CEC|nr:4-demethylwyosine synthase TYW1 [Candidatus Methanosphaera massiliense]MDD6286058.1 4-demethylwyosine synthase TYW1 [Methanobacteriaceae archaeon]MDE4077777.1 4-demethylwyosine synthase TYW1 [Candidatus Methanosphaera massiliense]MDY2744788.1 4-demethylwyosine synthase TYW1 [Methanosphaera sp.]
MLISEKKQKDLEKKGYRFAGDKLHAANKICHWTRKSIVDEGTCYKEQFYGIKSHRCLQMSPSVPYCQNKCLFCWRDTEITKTSWDTDDYDDPKTIIEDCINNQKQLLCGFFGNENANPKKLEECVKPNNAALSLAGEPLLYPEINQLIEEFHKQDFTTFLVSNGESPEKIQALEDHEPTQLYLSLDAPNEEIYRKVCKPQVNNSWQKLQESIELLSSIDTRKVLRITSVKNLNMTHASEYAKIIENSDIDYVEIKAYMFVGDSRNRLEWENMPKSVDIQKFAQDVANETSMEIIDEVEKSRVLLLGDKKPRKYNN